MRKIGRAAITSLILASLFSAWGMAGPDRLAAMQAEYDHESDAVRKAKDLAKLQPDEFEFVRDKLSAGDEEGALQELQHFRDEVAATLTALRPLAPKAESHPDGFKELQISLREALREMDTIIFGLPVDKRPWFREVRSDLQDSQNALIDILFPRQPVKQTGKNSPQ